MTLPFGSRSADEKLPDFATIAARGRIEDGIEFGCRRESDFGDLAVDIQLLLVSFVVYTG